MGMFRLIPPTAGFPVYTRDLLALLDTRRPRLSLEENVKRYLGVEYAQVAYSGTAALYLILEAIKEISFKRTVIIPSFICPLVPLAIARAGFRVQVCDIKEDSFDFDLEQLEAICARDKDAVAVVVAHLGGIPADFAALAQCARKHNLLLIEDCAQSLGAIYKGTQVGALGDFSFFSLCRGKGLTIYEGGLAVTQKREYGRLLDRKIKQLIKKDLFSETIKVCEFFGYWIFYRPLLFWFVFGLPRAFWNLRGNQLRAEIEYFSVDFATHAVSGFRKSLGQAGFYRLEDQIEQQRQKARIYMEFFAADKGLKVVMPREDTRATYPFVTLVFDAYDRKRRALQELRRRGLGGAQMYAAAITDYDYLKEIVPGSDCLVGRSFARRHLTVSTSTFLREKELALVAQIIKTC